MAFTVRNYTSDEVYDLGKFMEFRADVYDVINSPFLNKLKQLQTIRYYYVNNGNRDIDMISQDAYGTPFMAFYIQFYNNNFQQSFPEDTVLNLFNMQELEELYYQLSLETKAY